MEKGVHNLGLWPILDQGGHEVGAILLTNERSELLVIEPEFLSLLIGWQLVLTLYFFRVETLIETLG